MSDLAIDVHDLAKLYKLGSRGANFITLREHLTATAAQLFGRGDVERPKKTSIWALDGVSFQVREGEVVGVIGRNGAGKTTLLKILSRITEPTRGHAEFHGRLGSLLEVGTGFHPELSGRENIFLNGAILGMRRTEIHERFDEIVEFSGVAKFIDTPVKRYSSGMYVRLAFSVAAHLEPEILLVDEVLAVGDFEFQRKCLGKMHDIGRSGRTVLFVSHSMPTVARLCSRAVLLQHGKVALDGPTESVIAHYLTADSGTPAQRVWHDLHDAPGNEHARLVSIRVVDRLGETVESVDVRRDTGIEITFDILQSEHAIRPQLTLTNEQGALAFNAGDTNPQWEHPVPVGRYVSTAWIPGNLLNEGFMMVGIYLTSISSDGSTHHAYEQDAVAFHVTDPVEGDSAKGKWSGQWGGAVRPKLEWSSRFETELVDFSGVGGQDGATGFHLP